MSPPPREGKGGLFLHAGRVKLSTTKENHTQCLCQDYQPAEADKVGDQSPAPACCPLVRSTLFLIYLPCLWGSRRVRLLRVWADRVGWGRKFRENWTSDYNYDNMNLLLWTELC